MTHKNKSPRPTGRGLLKTISFFLSLVSLFLFYEHYFLLPFILENHTEQCRKKVQYNLQIKLIILT